MPLMRFQIDESSVATITKQFMDIQKNLQRTADSNYVNLKINCSEFNDGAKSANNTINEATTNTKNFASEMGNVIKRSLEWTAALIGIHSAIQEIGKEISFITDLDTKISDAAMITNKSRSEIEGMSKQWNQTAIDMKTTTDEVANASEEYLRAGKSISETNNLVETNIKLARVSGDTNKETAENLIKLSNAYNLNADGVDKFANKVAYLDSATATSSKDLLTSSTYMAGVAKQTGMSLDFMLASLATIQERSKQAPESIARNYRSMLENMQKVTKDGGGELSKLEGVLNKHGVAIRNNAREFKSSEEILKSVMSQYNKWDSVTKSQVGNLIAGKNAMEVFTALMQNQERVQENYNNALGATNNLDEKYKEHLNSTQGAINELKATSEKMWMSFLNSNVINGTVKGLTTVVNTIQYLGTYAKGSTLAIAGLSVAVLVLIKNASTLNIVFSSFTILASKVGVLTALSQGFGILTESVKAFTLSLLANPLTYVVAAIGVATVAIIKHIQHQKELKDQTDSLTTSYKSLTEAMKENNTESIKSNSDSLKKEQENLQKLLQQKKELEDKVSKTTATRGDNSLPKLESQLNDVNKALSEQEQVLKKAGVAYNSNTGQIYALTQAELQLKNNGIVDKINQEADAESKNKEMVKGLIEEYLQLNSVENKNSTQKERMSQLSQELSGYISGLKTTTDQYGNTTIQNTELLGKEVTILDTEGNTVKTLANVKLTAAKNNAQAQIGETTMTYTEISKRISMYSAESKALSDLYAQQGNYDAIVLGKQQRGRSLATGKSFFADRLSGLIDKAQKQHDDEYKALTDAKSTLDNIYSTGSTGSTNFGSGGSGGGNSSYIPDSSSSKSPKSSSSKSGSSSSNPNTQTFSVEPLDEYATSLKIIDSAFNSVNDKITSIQNKGKIFKDESDYANQLKNQTDLITAMNSKLAVTKDLQRQATNVRNIEVDKLQRSFGVANKIDYHTLAQMTEGDFDRLNPYKGMNVSGLSEAQKKAYEDDEKLWESLTKNILDANSKIKTFGNEIINTSDDILNTTKDKQGTIETYLNNLYEKDLKPLNDKLKSIQEDSKFIDNNDYVGKMKNLDEELSTQKEILSKNKEEYTNLKNLFMQDGVLTDDERKKLEDLNSTITDSTNKVRELNKAQQDLAQDLIKQGIEKQKELDEKQLENTKLQKESDLKKSIFGFSESEFNTYKNNTIALLEKEIADTKSKLALDKDNVALKDELTAKELKLSEIQSQNFNNVKDQEVTFNAIHQANIDAYDAQIKAIDTQNELEQEKEDSLKRQNDLIKIQTELTNTMNNQNIQELIKKADGTWDYTYTYDKEKADELQQQLKDKQDENAKAEKEVQNKHQKEMLEQEKQGEQDLINAKKDSYDQQDKDLDTWLTNAKNDLELKYNDIDKLTDNKMKDLEKLYGNNWDDIIKYAQDSLKTIQTALNNATANNNQLTNAANGGTNSSNVMVDGKIYSSSDTAGINKALNDNPSASVNVQQGDKWVDAMTGKEVAKNTLPVVSNNEKSQKPNNNSDIYDFSQQAMMYQDEGKVTTENGIKVYDKGNSGGRDSSVSMEDALSKALPGFTYMYDKYGQMTTTSADINNIKKLEDEGYKLVNSNGSLTGLNTGGMTTDWSDGDKESNGKLSILHPNEVVENPIDTKNLLQMSTNLLGLKNIIPENISQTMLNSMIPNIVRPNYSRINNKDVSQSVTNHFTIQQVDVADSTGFVDMLKDLEVNGIQYANNYKNRAYT